MYEQMTPGDSGDKKEKTSKELQWELSRTGWNLEDERRDEIIFELKKPLGKILHALSEDINNGNIQYLIGDDTSGRVPTLILRNCISQLYGAKDMPAPRTFFINGPGAGATLSKEEMRVRVEKITEHLGSRILSGDNSRKTILVTEAMMFGRSMIPIVKACQQLKLHTEIVSIGIEDAKEPVDLEKLLGVKINYGMPGTPEIYNKPAFAGVYKEKPNNDTIFGKMEQEASLLATPYKKTVMKDRQIDKQRWINEVRREIAVLSDELVEEYKKTEIEKREQINSATTCPAS